MDVWPSKWEHNLILTALWHRRVTLSAYSE